MEMLIVAQNSKNNNFSHNLNFFFIDICVNLNLKRTKKMDFWKKDYLIRLSQIFMEIGLIIQ